MPKTRNGELTPKQRAFVEIFVKENGRLTQTECARQAGYSEKSAVTQGSSILLMLLKHFRSKNLIDSSHCCRLTFGELGLAVSRAGIPKLRSPHTVTSIGVK